MLVPGGASGDVYYRKTNQPEVFYTERDILVPRTTEKAYIQFCADQLCRLAIGNTLYDVLLELDATNTYDREVSKVAEEVTEISGVPEGTTLSLMEPNPYYAWVQHSIQISFDGLTTVTYSGSNSYKTAEWGATGTELMESKGVSFTLNGPAPASAFKAVVDLTRKPARDLMELLMQLDNAQLIVWDDRLEPFMDSTIPSTRLVAYVLNALTRI